MGAREKWKAENNTEKRQIQSNLHGRKEEREKKKYTEPEIKLASIERDWTIKTDRHVTKMTKIYTNSLSKSIELIDLSSITCSLYINVGSINYSSLYHSNNNKQLPRENCTNLFSKILVMCPYLF